jgi:hypothetical protein
MGIVNKTKYMFFYLKGVLNFRKSNFTSAKVFFEKSTQCGKYYKNVLFYQYYGQVLLSLDIIDEAFVWLSEAYNLLEKDGWEVFDEEEYRLVDGTLKALKYIGHHHGISIEGFSHDLKISKKYSS